MWWKSTCFNNLASPLITLMNCVWKIKQNDELGVAVQCLHCGRIYPSINLYAKLPKRRISHNPKRWPKWRCTNPPGLRPAAGKLGISTTDIKHYVYALACWTAAGMPTRKQAEVERLEAICRECGHYHKGRCAKCGCCVNKSKVAVLNKIRMATESCPDGKW